MSYDFEKRLAALERSAAVNAERWERNKQSLDELNNTLSTLSDTLRDVDSVIKSQATVISFAKWLLIAMATLVGLLRGIPSAWAGLKHLIHNIIN